jgi:4-azaleucine resistance transporter AzlC
VKNIFKITIKNTLPIFFGYLFVGIAFGLLLDNAGYSWIWAIFISGIVYSGSLQFVLVSFLINPVSVFSVLITSIAVNSRYMFCGISFINRFKSMGKKKWYMIFALTDETYSLLYSLKNDKDLYENDHLLFLISFFNQIYWIAGSFIGAFIGDIIPFNAQGIEFAMTALFIIILLEQILSTKNMLPAIIGFISSIIAVFLFNIDNFILPALFISSIVLLAIKQFKLKGNTQ